LQVRGNLDINLHRLTFMVRIDDREAPASLGLRGSAGTTR